MNWTPSTLEPVSSLLKKFPRFFFSIIFATFYARERDEDEDEDEECENKKKNNCGCIKENHVTLPVHREKTENDI